MSNGNTTFHYDLNGERVPSIAKPVPEEVVLSEFGCRNCLYQGAECRGGSRYSAAEPVLTTQPQTVHPTCGGYAYYD